MQDSTSPRANLERENNYYYAHIDADGRESLEKFNWWTWILRRTKSLVISGSGSKSEKIQIDETSHVELASSLEKNETKCREFRFLDAVANVL